MTKVIGKQHDRQGNEGQDNPNITPVDSEGTRDGRRVWAKAERLYVRKMEK